MPAIAFGQTYNSGVKYIKINRYDSGGLDRSNYLGQLQSLTLTYPDRSAIEYPITSVQEQANYYLYGITPGYNTSSKGEIKNYALQVGATTTDPTPTDDLIIKVNEWGTPATDALGYFNSSSGIYTFGNTPNADILLYLSIGSLSNANTTHSIYKNLTATSYTLPAVSSSILPNLIGQVNGGGDVYIHLTGSKALKEGDTLAIYKRNKDFNPSAGVIEWTMNNRIPFLSFNGSSSLAIFNPDALNFDFNDYNPLLDNAETPQYSTTFMDVDYSQNPLTPVNFDLILAGTADRAFVQDSNYSSKAWSNIRYNGSKTTSYRIN